MKVINSNHDLKGGVVLTLKTISGKKRGESISFYVNLINVL